MRLWRFIPMHQNDKAKAERKRAELIFKAREQQKTDAPKATAEYYAAQQRLLERTQQLRQLRLEREAQSTIGWQG